MAKHKHKSSAAPKKARSTQKANAPKQCLTTMTSDFFCDWQPRWRNFLAQHPNWWESVPSHQPVYWLPEFVVKELACASIRDREPRGRPAFFTPEQEQAENTFRKCCVGFGASVVGVWEGSPVHFDPLKPPTSTVISEELMRSAGWDYPIQSLHAELDVLQSRAHGVAHQQLAHAGWVTFQDDYQNDKRILYTQWEKLDFSISWPLLSNTADQEPIATLQEEFDKLHHLPDNAQLFLEHATRFMRKWDLCRLSTWDLPLFQAPLEQLPVGPMRHLLGPNQIASVYSKAYDIPFKQDLRREIRDQQQRAGRHEGIKADFPLTDLSSRDGNPSKWQSAFHLWFIEFSVRQRLGDVRGLSSRLKEIFASILDCSEDWILQLRKVYRPHLINPHVD